MNALDMLFGQPSLVGMAQREGQRVGTPGINPNAPDPRPLAQPKGLDSMLDSPGGSFLMNLLAQSGYSDMPHSPIGAVGRAALASQQQQQQRRQFDLSEQLMKSRIGLNDALARAKGTATETIGKINPSVYTPDSVSRFSSTGDYGDLEVRPEATPSEVAEHQYFMSLSDAEKKDYINRSRAGRYTDVPGRGIITPDPNDPANPLTVVPESDITGGISERASSKAEGAGDPERKRAIPASLQKAQQTIDEIDDVIDYIEKGELKTGVVQGKFSQFSPEGELLRKLGNTKIIDLISEATFGQLSEGERLFLDKIAFGLERTETFNVSELKKFRDIIKKAMDIEARDARRLGVSDAAADADRIAEKYNTGGGI